MPRSKRLRFERLADDDATAERLLSSGRVRLAPAQDHGIATPLAQVVSASMWLVVARHGEHSGYAAMLEGGAPALRFGSKDPACRERLGDLGRFLTERLSSVLRTTPVPLAGIIREAVALGEDCHSRTAAANQALLRCLRDGSRGPLDAGVTQALSAMPAFVLPVLMAGAVAALRRHDCAIEALGGNGVDFGVRHRGAGAWTREPAAAPAGTRFSGQETHDALPAIGDSVLVDFCGLGGQVDAISIRDALRNPANGILDPARIADASLAPAFNLAILDAAGVAGLIRPRNLPSAAHAFRLIPRRNAADVDGDEP